MRFLRISRTQVPMLSGLAVFVLLCLGFATQNKLFRNLNTYTDLLTDGSFLGLAAIGMTFVILSGGIDLSVGAVVALSTVLVVKMIGFGASAPVAICISLAAGVALGVVMGWIIATFDLPPFLVTLAGMFLARGAAYLLTLEAVTLKDPFYDRVALWNRWLESHVKVGLCGIVFLAVLIVAVYVLHFRRFGRNVYAVGGSEQSALLMGVPVWRTKVGVYVVSGLCSALAGVVHTIYMNSGDPTFTIGLELDAIAAVVIGGTLLTGGVGYVAGTFIGVLILGVIQTIINSSINSSWASRVSIGVLLLIFILLQKVVQVKESRSPSAAVPPGPAPPAPAG